MSFENAGVSRRGFWPKLWSEIKDSFLFVELTEYGGKSDGQATETIKRLRRRQNRKH